MTRSGHAQGSLCVFSSRVHEFAPEQRKGLDILARQVVEVLEQDIDPEVLGAAASYISIIGGSARRMQTTVEEVLDFSMIGGAVNRRPTRLSTMMSAVRQDVLPLIDASGAVVTVQDAHLNVDQVQVTRSCRTWCPMPSPIRFRVLLPG